MKNRSKIEVLSHSTVSDPRWLAVVARDKNADGTFYYSVKTTGVYCRPSCAARKARPENVCFHATSAAAESAGFRACKRCKPTQPGHDAVNARRIAKTCRLIERSDEPVPLKDLAKAVGMSVFHLHRLFKAATGLTPNQYAAAHRSRRVRKMLSKHRSVTEAIYGAGFNSSSRFYKTSNEVLGMTPTSFRSGAANITIHFAIGECSLGSILVAKSDRGVCAVLLGDDPALLVRNLQDKFPRANLIGDERGYESLIAAVVGLVEKPGTDLGLPLDIRGTAFQQRVWKALQQIPIGTTMTYTELARTIGRPKAVRAVAQACGANSIAVAIPCHRIIRTDGGLAGYRWGIERKRALLENELAHRS